LYITNLNKEDKDKKGEQGSGYNEKPHNLDTKLPFLVSTYPIFVGVW